MNPPQATRIIQQQAVWLTLRAFFFISNAFISNPRLKLAKNQANAKQHPETEDLLFESYSYSLSTLPFKNLGHILKNKEKNKFFCIHEIIRLIIMKMKTKLKNKSHRYYINRPTSRHRHKYCKYVTCLTMMMLIFIKQRLSNI